MFRLSLRNLVAKKLRLLTLVTAIVLGVAFTTGTMILADTMSASFSSTIDDIADGVDSVVRGHELDQSAPFTPRAPVPLEQLSTVAAIPGVGDVEPYWEGYTQVVGRDGKALDAQQSVGLNWIDDPALSMFELTAGRAPRTAGEVVLGADTASDAELTVGDAVTLITTSGTEQYTIVGLSELDGGASLGDTSFAFFQDEDAASRLGAPGTADALLVRAADGTDEASLTDAVAAASPALDVVTGSDYADDQKEDLGTAIGVFETILLVFGGIALFVGSFTIANTFTVTIAQRTKELAVVRAIGASRRQVLASVVAEATMLGAVGAALGLAAGLGIAKGLTAVLAAVGLEFPERALVVDTTTVAVAAAAGVLVTVGAAIVPARRASAVAPIDAMRDATLERTATSIRRMGVGATLGAVGAAALLAGVARGSAPLVGVGSLAAFHAVIALGPMLVQPITSVVAAPMRRLGPTGRLAAANALRNPKRSAATAAALTIGVMLVAGASMFASTARATILGDTADVLTADRVVRPIGTNPGIPTAISARLRTIDGLTTVPMQTTSVKLGDELGELAGLDIAASGGLVDLEVVDGAVTGTPGTVVVADRHAGDAGLIVGDRIDIEFGDGSTTNVTVEAIVEATTALPAVIAPYQTVAAHGDGLDRLVLISGDPATLRSAADVLAGVPTVIVDSVDGYAESLAGGLDTVLSLVIGFLGLSVVIAVLGIGTTIGLSVHERTRELGVLRAVGMTRRQLRRSIRMESIMIAAFGTLTGAAMGVGFTWAALTTLDDQGFVAPVVPLGTLAAVALGALAAGTIAAALPARRAARIPVLEAIRTA